MVAVSVAQDGYRLRNMVENTIVTELEFDLRLPQPVNGTWNVTCATADTLTDHQWNVTACRVTKDWSPLSNVTRCHCPSIGLFAVLVRVVSKVSTNYYTL